MKQYQELFEKVINERLDNHFLMAMLIAKKIKHEGVDLNFEQIEDIKAQILLAIELNRNFIELDFIDKDVSLGVIEDEEIRKSIKRRDKLIIKLAQDLISIGSEEVTKQLKSDAPLMLKEYKKIRKGFEKRLTISWGEALDLFETFLVIATEAGDSLNEEFRKNRVLSKYPVFEVISRLHARGCQVGHEILTLLRAGYSDGALARWRSLHEISTIAYFIRKRGKQVAKRYIDYLDIENYKAAVVHNTHYKSLMITPFTEEEMEMLRQKSERLIEKYGEDFSVEYGWAGDYFKKKRQANKVDNKKTIKKPSKLKINFIDFEEDVGLKHLRPYYKFASYNVHVNTWRIFNAVGLDEIEDDILMTGPSNMGLTLPAHCASISILQITNSFLSIEPSIDNTITSKILEDYSDAIKEVFLEAKSKIRNSTK